MSKKVVLWTVSHQFKKLPCVLFQNFINKTFLWKSTSSSGSHIIRHSLHDYRSKKNSWYWYYHSSYVWSLRISSLTWFCKEVESKLHCGSGISFFMFNGRWQPAFRCIPSPTMTNQERGVLFGFGRVTCFLGKQAAWEGWVLTGIHCSYFPMCISSLPKWSEVLVLGWC